MKRWNEDHEQHGPVADEFIRRVALCDWDWRLKGSMITQIVRGVHVYDTEENYKNAIQAEILRMDALDQEWKARQ